MKIDFVITWVDGNDPEWRREKAKYDPNTDEHAQKERYRDMGSLKYWFRAVEKYAPWVNKVHFVTCGHLPSWLNTECEKLNIVKHEDYMPQKYLPTFSSRPIEWNFFRIDELSEHFVYFNDDMFLNGTVTKDFFFKNGLPCDFAYADSVFCDRAGDMYAHTVFNEISIVNKYFSYVTEFFKHPLKYVNVKYPIKKSVKNLCKLGNANIITGFEDLHLGCPFTKSEFEKMWETEGELLDAVCGHKFRQYSDISQRTVRYMRLAEGNFSPVSKKSRGVLYHLHEDVAILEAALKDEATKMVCINDTSCKVDFDTVAEAVLKAMEEKFPEKSGFEK